MEVLLGVFFIKIKKNGINFKIYTRIIMITSKLFKLNATFFVTLLLCIEIYAQVPSLGAVGEIVNIPNMFNSGIGEGVNLGDGDQNYRYGANVAIVCNPNPTWMANTDVSRWISQFDHTSSSGGTHVFSYTFSLDGLDPETAVITGGVGADNGIRILLNGVQILDRSSVNNLADFTEFTMDDHFNEGENTIVFQVNNHAPGPMALRVEYDTATATVVPEPSVYGLLSGIFVFSLIVFNKRKIK